MLNKCSGSLTLLAVRRFCGPCRRLHYHKDNPNNINIAKNLLNNNIQARCSTNEASWKLAQKELDLKIREYEQKLKDVKLNDINKKVKYLLNKGFEYKITLLKDTVLFTNVSIVSP